MPIATLNLGCERQDVRRISPRMSICRWARAEAVSGRWVSRPNRVEPPKWMFTSSVSFPGGRATHRHGRGSLSHADHFAIILKPLGIQTFSAIRWRFGQARIPRCGATCQRPRRSRLASWASRCHLPPTNRPVQVDQVGDELNIERTSSRSGCPFGAWVFRNES